MSNNSILDAMDVARFDAKIDDSGVCHLWTAGTSRGGYGMFRLGSQMVTAHRVSWTMHRGPIPVGQNVLHDCPGGDNRLCVNPEHLWLGTQAQNLKDMARKGRSLVGVRNPSAKLDAERARSIRESYAGGGATQRALAATYGVSQSVINAVIHRRAWRHA